MFIDTHIVSYAKKGRSIQSIQGAQISSVVASELLSAYGSAKTAANYYVPVLSYFHIGESRVSSMKRDHPYPKRVTDQIVFDFGGGQESIVEFGSVAIARMINDKNSYLLRESTAFLDKAKQKMIRENFDFIIENELTVCPG